MMNGEITFGVQRSMFLVRYSKETPAFAKASAGDVGRTGFEPATLAPKRHNLPGRVQVYTIVIQKSFNPSFFNFHL